MDRAFVGALTLSLAGHTALCASVILHPSVGTPLEPKRRLKLQEERPAAQAERPEVATVLEKVRFRMPRRTEAPQPFNQFGEARGSGEAVQRPLLGPELGELADSAGAGSAADILPHGSPWAAGIDLADIAQAAGGNPVLLSYFGAVRERIQQAADRAAQTWDYDPIPGTVYIGFIITRTGAIQSAGIVQERSVASAVLRTASLQLVQSAAPFPPLPPSVLKTSSVMTLLVPIEFSEVAE